MMRTTVLLVIAQLLAGCSAAFQYQPVMPYERGRLADPLMSLSRDPVSDAHLQHVLETREGARGGSGAGGGGCGCN